MNTGTPEYGLLIDYEYCTGCHACEVACAQENRREAGTIKGIEVLEYLQVEKHLLRNWKVPIINGTHRHAVLLELFTDKGIGTEIVK